MVTMSNLRNRSNKSVWSRGLWAQCLMLLAGAAMTIAHPMGNFSINHYSKLKIAPNSVEVSYIIDMAEIPTFQEAREFEIGPASSEAVLARYLD